jgi:hypothetical protein
MGLWWYFAGIEERYAGVEKEDDDSESDQEMKNVKLEGRGGGPSGGAFI